MPAKRQASQAKSSEEPSSEERARAAMPRRRPFPGDKVRLTFRVVLARRDAEALSARAIREEHNV
jgi:hypothetical protein